jgi:hypothetical protein
LERLVDRYMFKLTKEEQVIVAFLLLALLTGMAVREWRARHPRIAAAALEIKGH